MMIKGIYRIICLIFFITACPLASTKPEDNNHETLLGSFFMSPGFNFGSGLFLGQIQMGVGYSFFHQKRFKFQLGPQTNLAFGPTGILADIEAFLKADYDLWFSRSSSVNIYGKVPLGYSITFAGGGGAGGFNHGLNFGLIPGIEFFLSENMGIFAEAGFFHRIFGISPGRKTRNFPSGVVNVGMMFRF